MGYIEGKDRHQLILMNTIDDLVSQDNPVRLIDALVESIGRALSLDTGETSTVGRNPYKKTTLLRLYLYGYLNRISSSRRLETETQRNIELIWLMCGLSPDHWTISYFRKENSELIKEVTIKFREYLIEKGYIKMKRVVVDGSKIKANSKRGMLNMAKIEKRLEGLEVKLNKYIKTIEENDEREDETEDDDINNERDIIMEDKLEELDKINKEIKKLRKAKETLVRDNRKYISLTDPEAGLMKTTDGKMAAYNVQAVVDDNNHMIVYSEVTTEASDNSMIECVMDKLIDEIGGKPEEAIFDGGYYNLDMIEKVQKDKSIECYVNPNSPKQGEISFTYDKTKDEYRCSEGKVLKLFARNKKKRNSIANVYRGIECSNCNKRQQCTTSEKGRIVHRYHNEEFRDSYLEKMSKLGSKQRLKKRKTIIEHTFGTIKILMGKIPLLLRGIKKVATEINIYATVYNLKRLMNIENIRYLVNDLKHHKWELA